VAALARYVSSVILSLRSRALLCAALSISGVVSGRVSMRLVRVLVLSACVILMSSIVALALAGFDYVIEFPRLLVAFLLWTQDAP